TLPMALSQGILGARMWHPTTLPPAGPARPSKAVTAAPGACDLKRNPTPAQRTRVQDPFVLFPAGTIDRGPAQHSSSGAVHSPYTALLARWRGTGTTAVRSPSADGPACIPMGKPRGLQPGDQLGDYAPGSSSVTRCLSTVDAFQVRVRSESAPRRLVPQRQGQS